MLPNSLRDSEQPLNVASPCSPPPAASFATVSSEGLVSPFAYRQSGFLSSLLARVPVQIVQALG